MEENNKILLDKLISDTLNDLENDPDNKDLIEKLETLTQLSIKDYTEASKAYSEEMKAVAEREKVQNELNLKKRELDLKEKELAQTKKDNFWGRVLKGAGIACPFIIGMGSLHADRIGEFVHKMALPWASKFGKND